MSNSANPRNTMPYEEWLTERLQNNSEAVRYLHSVIEAYLEDPEEERDDEYLKLGLEMVKATNTQKAEHMRKAVESSDGKIHWFRKKAIVITAAQVESDNMDDFFTQWAGGEVVPTGNPDKPYKIFTREGIMVADKGDWVIKGVDDEFYPCKEDIFSKTYDKVK